MEQVTPQAPAQDTTNASAQQNQAAPAQANAPTAPETPQAAPAQTESKPSEIELKLPEGSRLNPEVLDQIKSYAKDKNLSSEIAQEILMREHKAIEDLYESSKNNHEQTIAKWAETAKLDPEYGGENFGQSVEIAKRALEKFATPQLIEEINATGYGNHPEVIRLFTRIGKLLANDKMEQPGSQMGAAKPLEEIFYGKQN